MSADIIAFRPKSAPVETDAGVDPMLRLLTAANEPDEEEKEEDVHARYQRALPMAREFVDAWIDQPEALVDFLAWAHARGALKF